MRVVWTAPALRQLEEIQDYIAEDNPLAAFEIAETIQTSVHGRLLDHPMIGRRGRVKGTRELVVSDTPYIVAYRVQSEEIQILAIKHGAQQWPDTL